MYTPDAPGGVVILGDDDDGKTEVVTEPWVNLLIAIAAIAGGSCLGAYLVAYQLYLKYPVPVRKVRKYRKTLKKKVSPALEIMSRTEAFKMIYKTKLGNIATELKSKTPKKIVEKDKIIIKSQ